MCVDGDLTGDLSEHTPELILAVRGAVTNSKELREHDRSRRAVLKQKSRHAGKTAGSCCCSYCTRHGQMRPVRQATLRSIVEDEVAHYRSGSAALGYDDDGDDV